MARKSVSNLISTAVTSFSFENIYVGDSFVVHTIQVNGETWFRQKDICSRQIKHYYDTWYPYIERDAPFLLTTKDITQARFVHNKRSYLGYVYVSLQDIETTIRERLAVMESCRRAKLASRAGNCSWNKTASSLIEKLFNIKVKVRKFKPLSKKEQKLHQLMLKDMDARRVLQASRKAKAASQHASQVLGLLEEPVKNVLHKIADEGKEK